MTNQSKSFDFLVFIGRFQPFHNGHEQVVDQALHSANQVILLCGSAFRPRCQRNPWSYDEREAMIRGIYTQAENRRIRISPLLDILYNDELWVQNVQRTVTGIVTAHHKRLHEPARVGLIGHRKDASSYYLNLFPQWAGVSVPHLERINATDIRKVYFSGETLQEDHLPQTVHANLARFKESADFQQIQQEREFIGRYQAGWAQAPYPPTFVTVDAVVVQSGHVLLVERKAQPGQGLLALPGGFLDPRESMLEAVIRELREETRLKVPEPVLRGSLVKQAAFDDPYRSARGRTIT
ncbi:MAG: bifunctional nicotinamide-nucleotide adenylyltransferase/Nudix hydroxylase, partial [Methylococcales bacterium]